MSYSRRKTLALIGGGTLVAAGAGGAVWANTRAPSRALAPWGEAGAPDDHRLAALSYAILAPNPHNLQPWMVGLEGTDTATLWRDPSKALPMTDPADRQVVIGLGCFLEQARIAATMTGHAVETELWPDGVDGPVAAMRFASGAARDPLADAIMDRRSCKEPFGPEALSEEDIAALAAVADRVVTDPAEVEAIKAITLEAWTIEAYTPRTMKESADLMRFGRREIEANPDGIDMGGPMLEGLHLAGLLDAQSVVDPESSAFAEGARMYDEMLRATPAYTVIIGADGPEDRIEAGRRYLRLNLAATAAGVSLHPVSQALQEFPEMAGPYAAIHERLAPGGGTVHMLARAGYGPAVPRTPRWPLEAKML